MCWPSEVNVGWTADPPAAATSVTSEPSGLTRWMAWPLGSGFWKAIQASPGASGAGAASAACAAVAAHTSAAVLAAVSVRVVRGGSRHGASFLSDVGLRAVGLRQTAGGVRPGRLRVIHEATAPPSGVTTTSERAKQMGSVPSCPGRITGSPCGTRSSPYPMHDDPGRPVSSQIGAGDVQPRTVGRPLVRRTAQ